MPRVEGLAQERYGYPVNHPTTVPEAPHGAAAAPPDIMFALLGAAHALEDRIDRALGASGLSMSKLGVLTQLVDARTPLALSELAARLSCVRSNMTQLVDRLEADGLVRRVNDPNDRRSVLAEVTTLGEERQQQGAQELARVREQFIAALAPAENDTLRRALDTVHISD